MVNKPKKRKPTLWIVLGLVAVLITLIVVKRATTEDGLKVEAEKAEVRDIFAKVSESGVIQPTIEVPVAPDVSGEIVSLYVEEGMRVKKGDLLVTIRPDDYRSTLERTEASLNSAKAAELQARASVKEAEANMLQDSINLERNKDLYKQEVISKMEYESNELRYKISRSRYESAKLNVQAAYYQAQSAAASVKQARQSLDRTNIYASMDGTITKLSVEVGQRVVGTAQMQGTEILRIADLSSMEVLVEINENDIVNVNLKDSARIEVDAFPDKSFFGTVTEIAYSATSSITGNDQVTSFEVKVKISPSSYASEKKATLVSNSELQIAESPFRPGMTALVDIFTEWEKGAISVPIQAVTLSKEEKDGDKKDDGKSEGEEGEKKRKTKDEKPQEVVYVVKDGLARERAITTSISDDNYIVVKSGLQAGEQVVIGPYTTLTKTLTDSTAVTIEIEKEKKKPWEKD